MHKFPQRDQCSFFTTAEVARLLGTGVDAGESSGPVPDCDWFGKDEQSYVIVQVVDTTSWVDPRQAPGYELLAGVVRRAYSHRDAEGGWRAMARTDRAVAVVVMIGRHGEASGRGDNAPPACRAHVAASSANRATCCGRKRRAEDSNP